MFQNCESEMKKAGKGELNKSISYNSIGATGIFKNMGLLIEAYIDALLP